MKRFLIIPLVIALATTIPVKGQNYLKNTYKKNIVQITSTLQADSLQAFFLAKLSIRLMERGICTLNIITGPINGGWLRTTLSTNMGSEICLLKQDLKTQMVEEIFL